MAKFFCCAFIIFSFLLGSQVAASLPKLDSDLLKSKDGVVGISALHWEMNFMAVHTVVGEETLETGQDTFRENKLKIAFGVSDRLTLFLKLPHQTYIRRSTELVGETYFELEDRHSGIADLQLGMLFHLWQKNNDSVFNNVVVTVPTAKTQRSKVKVSVDGVELAPGSSGDVGKGRNDLSWNGFYVREMPRFKLQVGLGYTLTGKQSINGLAADPGNVKQISLHMFVPMPNQFSAVLGVSMKKVGAYSLSTGVQQDAYTQRALNVSAFYEPTPKAMFSVGLGRTLSYRINRSDEEQIFISKFNFREGITIEASFSYAL